MYCRSVAGLLSAATSFCNVINFCVHNSFGCGIRDEQEWEGGIEAIAHSAKNLQCYLLMLITTASANKECVMLCKLGCLTRECFLAQVHATYYFCYQASPKIHIMVKSWLANPRFFTTIPKQSVTQNVMIANGLRRAFLRRACHRIALPSFLPYNRTERDGEGSNGARLPERRFSRFRRRRRHCCWWRKRADILFG